MDLTRRGFLHACTTSVLAHVAVPLAVADTITGKVTDTRGTGLSRVRISNGRDIVLTDDRGRFELPPPRPLSFVFASTPSGYAPEKAPYIDIAGTPSPLTFTFRPAPARASDRLRIAHLSDSHTALARYPHYATAAMFAADIRHAIREAAPDLVVVTGDLTDIGRREDLAEHQAETVAAVGAIPLVSLFAGHDALDEWADVPVAGGAYRALFGPQWFSFDWGPWRVLVFPELNTPDAGKSNQVTLETWMDRELALLESHQRVVVITHDPPRWHSSAAPDMSGPRLDRLPPQAARPVLIVHGQYHSSRIVAHEGTTVVGATSSTMGGIDTSPRGYGVLDLRDGAIAGIELRPFVNAPAVWRPRSGSGSEAPAIPGYQLAWQHALSGCLHRAAPCWARGLWIAAMDDRPDPRAVGLVAIDGTAGTEAWRWRSDSTIKNGVVAADTASGGSVLYALSVAGRLTAIDTARGTAVWETLLPNAPDRWMYTRPLVDRDTIVIAQYSGSSAYDRHTGRRQWQEGQQAEDGWSPVYQSPAAHDGLMFVLTTKSLGHYAVSSRRISSGEIVWMRRLDTAPKDTGPRLYQLAFPTPLVTAAGLVVSGLGHRMLMLDSASGETLWDTPALLHEGPRSGVDSGRNYHAAYEHAIGGNALDDLLVVTTANGCAYGLDLHTGRRRWQFITDRPPLVDAVPYLRGRGTMLTAPAFLGRHVFTGGADGFLYVLDAGTGRTVAEVAFGAPITTPVVTTDVGLLVTTFDGRAYWYVRAF